MGELVIRTAFEETVVGGKSTIHVRHGSGTEKRIYYEFAGEPCVRKPPTDDFAVIALLHYAMRHRLDIRCAGRVTRDQMERLEEAQDAWSVWHPDLFRRVRIQADEEVPAGQATKRDAILAYSGGVDATFALHAHARGILGRRTNAIRAGVMIHGFDISLDKPEAFARALARGRAIVESYGVPLVAVKTNWRQLGDPWEQSFILGVSAVVHQFAGTTSRAIVASDEAYDGEVLGWGSNSITNALMGHAGFPIDFTGAGYSRTKKAAALAGEPAILDNIRVCFQHFENGSNCGKCEKCIRTKLNFLAAGARSVPALGPTPTASEIDRLIIKNPAVMALYRDLLENGDWAGHEDLQLAVRRIIQTSFVDRHWRELRKVPQRWRRFMRKHVLGELPRTRPVLDGA